VNEIRLATDEANRTKTRPITTLDAAWGFDFFQSPTIGKDDPMYIRPNPITPRKAKMGATICNRAFRSVKNPSTAVPTLPIGKFLRRIKSLSVGFRINSDWADGCSTNEHFAVLGHQKVY
jgi:hypothetical protein